MPDDRFLHPRLGHSEKVNKLTDLEFRVWVQYLLTADDFGVMRLSAVSIQAANDALHARPMRAVQKALDRLVDIGLLAKFKHQDREYICQLDWHHYQKVRLPRRSIHPMPPPDVLARCEEGTLNLFSDHAASVGMAAVASNAASTELVDVASDGPQIKANGKRLTANGKYLRDRDLFGEFWKHYPRKVGKEAAWRAWQKVQPTNELVAAMLATLGWQRQQPDWLKDGGRFIPHPSTWLNQQRWLDEPSTIPQMSAATATRAKASSEFLKS